MHLLEYKPMQHVLTNSVTTTSPTQLCVCFQSVQLPSFKPHILVSTRVDSSRADTVLANKRRSYKKCKLATTAAMLSLIFKL